MLTDTTRPPLYSPSLRKWLHHHRDPPPHHTLHPLAPPIILIPATYHPTQSGTRRSKTDWWYRCLSLDAPETGAAVGHIDDLLGESQVVTAYSEILDPTIGSLLAFGSALDEVTSGRYVDTAAFAMGRVGAEVGVGKVVEEWRVLESTEVDMKGIGAATRTLKGPLSVLQMESRVRQIAVAGNCARGEARSNMAVRTANSTTIFRQRRLGVPLPGQTSTLAAVPLVSVPSGTGKAAHAHVEFNPWYERQFGIIDGAGKWRIYDLEGVQSRDWRLKGDIKVAEAVRGSLGEEGDGDGWGRLTWGGDFNTLVGCGRSKAGVFDIRTAPSAHTSLSIPTYQGHSQFPLLDLQLSPSTHPTPTLFLLTCSTLTWHDLRFPVKPIMSVPHYRSQNDISLSMAPFPLDQATINVLLYSRLNHLTTSHSFDHNDAEDFPITFGYPKNFPGIAPTKADAPVQLCLTVLPTGVKPHDRTPDAEIDDNLRAFTAYSVAPDLSISERHYSTQLVSIAPVSDKDRDHIIPAPMAAEAAPSPHPPEPRISLHELYTHAFPTHDPTLRTATPTDTTHSIAASLSRLRAAMETRLQRADLGIIPLHSLLAPQMLYDHLDTFSEGVEELLNDPEMAAYTVRSLLPAPKKNNPNPDIPDDTAPPPSAESLYASILSSWVTPLPLTTPPAVRLRRERLARALATTLFLASRGVNLPRPAEELKEGEPPEHLLGIRTYANVGPRIVLDESMAGILGRWKIGQDPEEVGWVGEGEEGGVRRRVRRRRVEGWVGERSQGVPPPVAASQVVVPVVAASQLGSSQVGVGGPGLAVMSQVERGRHGGRAPVQAGRKKRRTGF